MSLAKGTFEVKIEALEPNREREAVTFSRMSIDKRWRGELEGTSDGQMLTAGSQVDGRMSAGYVAIERVDCTLGGRRGSFVFQHSATMNRGEQQLSIGVVPDSGSGDLAGISGSLAIEIADGTHSYTFDYTLPSPD